MIYNERQYKVTLGQIEALRNALNSIPTSEDMDWLQTAQKDALQSQINDLEAQAREYSLLKEGKNQYLQNANLSSLPKVLIQARIGLGLSQRELAERLDMPTQQVQRYEASGYMGANLSRLIEIADVLGVSVKESWSGKNINGGSSFFIWDDEGDIKWSDFPIKDMVKRGWLDLGHKTSPSEAVKNYFYEAAGAQYVTALHRKKFHGGNRPNEYALLAWQARVLQKARTEVSSQEIGGFDYVDTWVSDLVALSVESDAPIKVKDLLASKGIILVTERHLPGTYLDGAAMMLETGHPVIALTLRHDRLDNFWFVLMHELGHVFLHLFDSLNMDFFDEEDHPEDDDLEKEADKFALDYLIPPESWELCLSRFSITRETVLMDASNLGIHPSIIAGRIRKENNNYTILSDLIGRGEVRIALGGTE